MLARNQIGGLKIAVLACAMIFAAAGAAFAKQASPDAASQGAAASGPAAEPSSAPLYTDRGAATCFKCHDEAPVTNILVTPHAMKGDLRTPFGQHECETCHGPSETHAAGTKGPDGKKPHPSVVFIGPNASPVAERNKVCLSCHQSGLRMNWQGGKHERNGLACVSCHTIHATKDPILVKATQPDKCFTCHATQRAQSFQYSHHPIREGLVVCSDCHNPHGSPGPKMLKEFTVNETCYNCHAEKRGPFLWEHQPVREDCTNCHTPHGSTQPRLMKERMNFMCSSCHSAASSNSGGAFGGAHAIAGRQGSVLFNSALANQRMCLNCHSQIHGSNSPNGSYFFR